MHTFSIIIPLYNKEKYISRTIQSVLDQSYTNFEIVVVDDGSTDNGVNIVLGLGDDKIRVIKQENSGVSAARNKGIEESKFDYCAFLDADDEWNPNFLEIINSLIIDYPEASAYCTAYDLKIGDAFQKPKFVPYKQNSESGLIENYFYSRIKGDSLISTSSICVKKTVLQETGGFVVGEKLGEDQDLWIKIAFRYNIAFSKQAAAIYNIGLPGSACISNLPNENIIYIKNLKVLLKKNEIPQDLVREVKLFISKQLINISRINILNNKAAEGRRIILNVPFRGFLGAKIIWLLASFVPFKFYSELKRLINKKRYEIVS